MIIKGNKEKIVETKLCRDIIIIISPCKPMAVNFTFRVIREGERNAICINVMITPAQVGIISRIRITTISINRICTVSVVIIGLTIATEATHDGVVITLRQRLDVSNNSTCSFIVTKCINVVPFCGSLEGSSIG